MSFGEREMILVKDIELYSMRTPYAFSGKRMAYIPIMAGSPV